MKVLVIDIGGTNIKVIATGQNEHRKFPSGPTMVPREMVAKLKEMTKDWEYEAVSICYPGVVKNGKIVTEPHNLGPGWVGFNFNLAFKCPVKILNDAAMQALGSFKKGILLFLGLGTGLGSAIVADGIIVPMEVGHLPFRKKTYEDYFGNKGLKRLGKKKWTRYVTYGVERLQAAVLPDDIVLGGGNAINLKKLPSGCRLGDNSMAFAGGFKMWEEN